LKINFTYRNYIIKEIHNYMNKRITALGTNTLKEIKFELSPTIITH